MENGTLYDQLVTLWPALGSVPEWVVFATIALLMVDLGLIMVLLLRHIGRKDPFAEYKAEHKKERPSDTTYTREYRKHPSGTGWSDTDAARFREVQRTLKTVAENFRRVSREISEGKDAGSIEIFPPRPSIHNPYIEAAKGLKIVESSDGSYWVGDRKFSSLADARAYLDLVRRAAKYN